MLALVVLLSVCLTGSYGNSPAAAGFEDIPWGYEVHELMMTPSNFAVVQTNLSGTFWRHGAAIQTFNHWFLALGLVNSFSFADGKALYSAKFQEVATYCLYKPPYARDIPCNATKAGNPHQNIVGVYPTFDNQVLLTSDDACWDIVEPETIDTKEFPFTKSEVPCTSAFDPYGPAHIGWDPYNHTMVGLAQQAHGPYHPFMYQLYETTEAAPSERQLRATFPPATHSVNLYIHSFAFTPHYVIVMEQPFENGFLDGPFPPHKNAFVGGFKVVPGMMMKWTVFSRKDWGIVSVHQGPARCFFHQVNAFEAGNDVMIDFVAFDCPEFEKFFHAFTINQLMSGTGFGSSQMNSRVERWSVPIFKNSTLMGPTSTATGLRGIEMPVMNFKEYTMKPYRYFYTTGVASNQSVFWDILYKYDHQEAKVLKWFEKGTFVQEPFFVKNPMGTAEDAGYVVAQGMVQYTNTTFILVLNAETFQEIGRYWLPGELRVPFGLHGWFI